MPFTQTNRLIAIDSPLGKDVLLLRGFTGQEGISQMFHLDLDLLSEDPEIKFKDIIGQRVTVRVRLGNDKERFFNGFINRFTQVGGDTGLTNYRASVVPWLWFLTRTTDCRIFQNKTIPDIIQQVFKDLGFTDFKVQLRGTYQPREYCVQYRETDLNFVSRLMERYGIFYFFQHEEKKHTLILADAPGAHQPCPEQAKARWEPQGSGALAEDVLTSVQIEQVYRSGKFTLTDYNFEAPTTSLVANVETTVKMADNTKYEFYDYPGEYGKKKDGEALVRLRMEEEEAHYLKLSGNSTCRAFTAGYRFDLVDYVRPDMDGAYVLTEIHHMASVGDTYTTGEAGGSADYSNIFTCIPHAVPFRPPRVTPKPVVQGPQTAVVVGPKGEEIFVDKYGRVKVQFYWDREGRYDESSSGWFRVSQVHAGKGFGAVDIPRIGEEVIVGFLEGDADCPIIVGRVYNGQNMPPNGLPASGMVSGLKSNSTPGGGGCNCVMLDDTKGKEKLDMNAQYNMSTSVGNDQSCSVTNNCTTDVGVDDKKKVGSNQDLNVGAKQTIAVGGPRTLNVGGTCSETIGGSMTVSIGGPCSETIAGPHSIANPMMTIATAAVYAVSAGSSISQMSPKVNLTAGSKMNASSGGTVDVKAGGKLSQQSGAAMNIKSGAALKAQSGAAMSLKAGAALKAQSSAAMQLKAGAALKAQSSAAMSLKSGAALKADASGGLNLKAGGAISQKGSAIKLNSPTKIKGTTLTVS